MDEQQSQKQGLKSSAQKEDQARDAYAELSTGYRRDSLVMEKSMSHNKNDGIREKINVPSSGGAMQDFDGMSATYFLTANEEELCEYLVTKYQNHFPLTDDRKYEFQQDHRLFAETIRRSVIKRKANFV